MRSWKLLLIKETLAEVDAPLVEQVAGRNGQSRELGARL
jgi:hypothetical protein